MAATMVMLLLKHSNAAPSAHISMQGHAFMPLVDASHLQWDDCVTYRALASEELITLNWGLGSWCMLEQDDVQVHSIVQERIYDAGRDLILTHD